MAIQIRTSLDEIDTAEGYVPHRPARPEKVEGGKRPRSSMAPTLVYAPDGKLRLEPGGDPDATVAQLLALPGIGPWTAEVYLMFCLGVQDIFAPADLALQEGAKLAMGLETRPSTKQMAEIATRWAPWRAVAARALWAWYGHVKRRQGIVST